MICGRCSIFKTSSIEELEKHMKTEECRKNDPWNAVVNARKAGQYKLAKRLTHKILGISKPMSEESKEKLRRYNEENKELIAERRHEKYMLKKQLKNRMKARK